ncbi:MAG TPA: PilT/PilU family type 4a pilus ATPase [Rhodanobacteraceae bacterium]|nr:PilT/PilU family type 4a pilus ATPase [Rhodanobacteraceae bacterium]
MDLTEYLRMMVAQDASDLFLSVGAPPAIKTEGETRIIDAPVLDSAAVSTVADSLLDAGRKNVFDQTHEMNLTVDRQGIGRFRVNLYRQRGETGIAIRYIPNRIPSLESLNLPPNVRDLVMLKRGLVLVVGAAGSGKSTTLAALIDYRNQHRSGHILTIEDPIEFMHAHGKSIVDQREVGIDTNSYAEALKNAMREAPDVIMIGEIRDRETMEQALLYAETGQLCLATLHSNNANQTLDRILNFFPEAAHKQVLQDLSLNLKAVLSQRLLRSASGGRRVPAVELLLQTAFVSDLILKGEISQLKEAMKQGLDSGMLTFEESLLRLYRARRISMDEALENADSRSDLSLRVRLSEPLSLELEQQQRLAIDKSQEARLNEPRAGWKEEAPSARRI